MAKRATKRKKPTPKRNRAAPKTSDEQLLEGLLQAAEAEFLPEGAHDRVQNLLTSTDGEFVLSVCAIFDRLLGEILSGFFAMLSSGHEKLHGELLKRPLQDLAVRHDLCCALNLIGQETRDAISAIRLIRIDRAHGEFFKVLTANHVNGIRGACPTLLKSLKQFRQAHPMPFDSMIEDQPHLGWSKERVNLMEIVMGLHSILIDAKLSVQTGQYMLLHRY